MSFRHTGLNGLLALLILALSSAPARSAQDEIVIGLVDTFSPDFYLNTFVPTIVNLMKTFGEERIRVVEVDSDTVAREQKLPGELSFVVTSASTYAALIDSVGTHQIATRQPQGSRDPSRTVGSLFVTASGSGIESLEESKGMTVAVSSLQSFDGWQIAQGELVRLGFDPETHFEEVIETKYAIPDVTALVKSGVAAVGVLGSCEYETLLANGFLHADDLRILNGRPKEAGEVCRRSTELYPDAVFSSLPNVSPDIVNEVAVALLSMTAGNQNFRWVIASEFRPTLDLLHALRIGPFQGLREWTVENVWTQWKTEIILLLALCAAVLFHIFTLNLLVRRRTDDLKEAFEENERLLQERNATRSRLLALERLNIVAQLSNMFAHEIKQPITNISCYAGALRMLLKRTGALSEKADEILCLLRGEVERSAEIVEHVRSYAKKRNHVSVRCDLSRIAAETLRDFRDERLFANPDEWPDAPTEADPFELQFVITNFIKNALSAVEKTKNPQVAVSVKVEETLGAVIVADNGPRIPDETFESLGNVSMSKKTDGLGFGLAIAVALAERNGGHLAFRRLEPSGLEASLVMPLSTHSSKAKS